ACLLVLLNAALGGILVTVGPTIARRFYHAPALVSYMPLFALIMALGALNLFLGQVLAGYKDVIRRTAITSFLASPLNIILSVGLVLLGTGLWGYIFAQAVTASVVLCLLAISVWKLTPAASRAQWLALRKLEPEVVSFSAAAFGVGFLEFL